MRFIYADAGLHSGLGHHANSCRFIATELRRRGIQPTILAYETIEPDLAAELGAQAHFHGFSYYLNDGDPFCGWLNAFHQVSGNIRDDLLRLDTRQDDLVYVNSVQPGVFMGVIEWLAALPADRQPRVVVEFGTEPGVAFEQTPKGAVIKPRDPRGDPRGTLYRFAGGRITAAMAERLHLATFDDNSSVAYRALLRRPVGVLPFLQQATTRRRIRTAAPPLTVAVIGHQRPDKGYQLMPEVARLLLRSHPDIRLLVHNGEQRILADVQQSMRELAATDRRVSIDERIADPAIWAELLDAADLILCPYDPVRYVLGYSAVVAEAIANAIPVVVPARTALSRLLRDFESPGTTFAAHDAAAVAAATSEALGRFAELARLADIAANNWAKRYGPGPAVDAILGIGGPSVPGAGAAMRYPTTVAFG